MSTLSQEIEENRQARFEQFEAERLLVEEVTDLSERIPLPMDNSFEYDMEVDGHLYHLDQSLGEVLDTNLEVTKIAAQTNPLYNRHFQHALIERQEYDDQRRLACATEGQEDLLVVLSPKVGEMGKHLTMVRIYTKTEAGISAASISFDTSDNECLDNIAHFFGQSIPANATPEDILTMRLWGKKSDIPGEQPRTFIARLHDVVLEEKLGGVWSGGRPGTSTLDAQTFIRNQPDLLSEHMGLVRATQNRGGENNDELLEQIRYQTAAQLAERIKGVLESPNRETAGARARASGEKFENSCPTVGSVAQASQELGFVSLEQGTCRVCLEQGLVGACSVCMSCENADNADGTGRVLQTIHRDALAKKAMAQVKSTSSLETHVRHQETENEQPQVLGVPRKRGLEPVRHEAVRDSSWPSTRHHEVVKQLPVERDHQGSADAAVFEQAPSRHASRQLRGSTFSYLELVVRTEIGGGRRVVRNVLTGEEVEEDVA